jgi:hypothetical protein
MLSLLATEDLIEEGFFHTVSCNMPDPPCPLQYHMFRDYSPIAEHSHCRNLHDIPTDFLYAKPKVTRMSMLT